MRTWSRTALTLLLLLLAAGWTSAAGPQPAPAPEYTPGWSPLTDRQVFDWWATQTDPQKIELVRSYDREEHAIPVVPQPRYLFVLKGRDLYYTPQYPAGQDYDTVVLGDWDYHVRWKGGVIKGFLPSDESWKMWLEVVAGALVAGGLTGFLLAHR